MTQRCNDIDSARCYIDATAWEYVSCVNPPTSLKKIGQKVFCVEASLIVFLTLGGVPGMLGTLIGCYGNLYFVILGLLVTSSISKLSKSTPKVIIFIRHERG